MLGGSHIQPGTGGGHLSVRFDSGKRPFSLTAAVLKLGWNDGSISNGKWDNETEMQPQVALWLVDKPSREG